MKKTTSILFTFLLSGLLLTACKKDNEPEPNNNNNNLPAKQNDKTGSVEADAVIDDVNDFISNKIGGGSNARMAAYNLPCGVIRVDSVTTDNGKIYKMQYGNNTPCGYKKKSGEVTFELASGKTFEDSNAVVKIVFNNYTVEAVANGATVKLNGTITVTNIDGGYIWQAVSTTYPRVIKHKIRGTFDITYANNEVRPRSYYQLRTWSSSNGWEGLTFSVAGDTTITINDVPSSVSETGKTYEGNHDFQTEIITNFSWSNCGSAWAGPYVLKTGNAKMHVTIPNISPAYINVEAGYKINVNNLDATPTLVNDCSSNAYKITAQIGTVSNTQYQLY